MTFSSAKMKLFSIRLLTTLTFILSKNDLNQADETTFEKIAILDSTLLLFKTLKFYIYSKIVTGFEFKD